jgi:hypothetical protein
MMKVLVNIKGVDTIMADFEVKNGVRYEALDIGYDVAKASECMHYSLLAFTCNPCIHLH